MLLQMLFLFSRNTIRPPTRLGEFLFNCVISCTYFINRNYSLASVWSGEIKHYYVFSAYVSSFHSLSIHCANSWVRVTQPNYFPPTCNFGKYSVLFI